MALPAQPPPPRPRSRLPPAPPPGAAPSTDLAASLRPIPRRTYVISEPVAHPGRDAHRVTATPRGRARAAIVDERVVRGIVAVGLDAVAARTDVVVRVADVDGLGPVDVPAQLLVELVPVLRRVHVGVIIGRVWIVVVLTARIAHAPSGVRPTDRDDIPPIEQRLLRRKPHAVALPLVLELHLRRQLAMHVLIQIVEGQAERERVLPAELHRPLVTDVVSGVIGR